MSKELLLSIHPTFGMLAAFCALWVFIEVLNASDHNARRIWWGSVLTAVLMVITWISGGYWYVVYYATDKAIILQGSWPWAHNLIMETKEHLFFIALILALFLPLAVRGNDLLRNRGARTVALVTAALIILSALALEGSGALISMGVRVGLSDQVTTAQHK